ncbi:serine protease, partial [Methylobacterium trifolii]
MLRRARTRSFALATLTILAAGSAQAQALKPKLPAAAPATVPDPAFEAMRTAFEALPEAERKAIQDALVWGGDYNSVVTGGFGRRTFEALNAFRARAGAQGGVLGPA